MGYAAACVVPCVLCHLCAGQVVHQPVDVTRDAAMSLQFFVRRRRQARAGEERMAYIPAHVAIGQIREECFDSLAWRSVVASRLSAPLSYAIIPCRFFEHFLICCPHMTYAELELTLRVHADGLTAIDMRFRAPNSMADSDLVLGVPVAFDPPSLLAVSNDWMAYGRALTAQLFADSRMQMAWTRVQGFIEGAKTTLRLRLRIDPGADDLHGLRWELLQDPVTGQPLCRSQRVLFVRFLDTSELSAIVPPAHNRLRALVFIANPHDLTDYHLAPVDVAGEIARARVALGDLPTTLLARQAETLVSDPHPPLHGATLENLTRNLRAGFPLMVLVCHGSMSNVSGTDRPYLWLERDDGSSDQVAGETLVQRIADLDPQQRPLLIILAACQTAGRDQHAAVLAALGPQMTRAGVGAVIGMQGTGCTPNRARCRRPAPGWAR